MKPYSKSKYNVLFVGALGPFKSSGSSSLIKAKFFPFRSERAPLLVAPEESHLRFQILPKKSEAFIGYPDDRQLEASYQKVSIFVCCVDLTQAWDEKSMISHIARLKSRSPEAKIVLVGTKRDLLSHDISPETWVQLLVDIAHREEYEAVFLTSAKDHRQISSLFDALDVIISNVMERYFAPALQREPKIEPVISLLTWPLHELDSVSRDLSVMSSDDSPESASVSPPLSEEVLPEALSLDASFFELTSAIKNKKIRQQIEEEIHLFKQAWQNPHAQKPSIIDTFKTHCDIILKPSASAQVLNALASVIIAATVTLLAAVAGFGVGFALGLWTGPGAFFTGLVAGATAAVTVTAISGTGGLLSGGAFFFKKPSVMTALDSVVKEASAFSH